MIKSVNYNNSKISMSTRKNATFRLGGYYYQFQVAILRFIDVLSGNGTSVVLENAESETDVFDDMTFHTNEGIHHYQVKWGMNLQSELQLSDFYYSSSSLNIKKLFTSWHEYVTKKPNSKHLLHIYTSKQISKEGDLKNLVYHPDKKFLKNIDNVDTTVCFNQFFRENKKIKKLFDDILQQQSAKEADIRSFLQSLLIEFDKPKLPIIYDEKQHSPMKNFILTKIENKLGLNESPFYKDLSETYDTLLNLCHESAIYGKEIDQPLLEHILKISRNLNSAPQNFQFDPTRYVNPQSTLTTLINNIEKLSGKKLLLVGRPGSGKSWFLTNLHNEFNKSPKIKSLLYYCYTGEIGESFYEKRITSNQLFQNLISEIQNNYDVYVNEENPQIFSAAKIKLIKLLEKLGKKSVQQNQLVVIIIDGLDHVSRIGKNLETISAEDQTIIEFLRHLKVPKGICLIIGTQPNEIVYPSEYEQIKLGGFNLNETKELLIKFGISKNILTEKILSEIHNKTDGLPLLISYLALSNKKMNSITRMKILRKTLKELPKTDGNISKYYDWLWSEFENQHLVIQFARIISLLEFPATAELLEFVFPASSKYYSNIMDNERSLSPLLHGNKILFFHESFRRYVLEDKSFTKKEKLADLNNIFAYLTREPIYKNEISFRYALLYATRTKNYEKIFEYVTLDLIDNAIMHLRPQNDINRNIFTAIGAAVATENYAKLVEYSLLRKYTGDRLRDLNWNYLIETAYNLGLIKNWTQFVYGEDRTFLSFSEMIPVLSTAIKKNIQLNTKIILDWFHENPDPEDSLEGIVEDYAVVLTHAYGIKSALSWMQKNMQKNQHLFYIVYEKIAKTCNVSEILEQKTLPNGLESNIILALSLFYNNKITKSKEIVLQTLATNNFHTSLLLLAAKLKINSNLISKRIVELIPRKPVTSLDNDISNLVEMKRLREHVTILEYCDRKKDLQKIINEIDNLPRSSFRQIQKLTYEFARIEGQKLKGDKMNLKFLLEILDSFTRPEIQDHSFSSDLDCRVLLPFTNDLIKDIILCYLSNVSNQNVAKLLPVLSDLGARSNYVVSTSPLEHYLLIGSHLSGNNKQKLYQKITSEFQNNNGAKSSVFEFLLWSNVYQEFGYSHLAIQEYEKAIKFSHQYGYHKDTLLWDLLDLSNCLNEIEPQHSMTRCSDILQLTPLLDIVTDRDHTKHTPGMVIEEITKRNPLAASKLILQFPKDSWTYMQGFEAIIKNHKESSLALRFLLAETLHFTSSHYNDEYWAFDIRLNLIKEALQKHDKQLAKFMLYRTRYIFSYPFSASPRNRWHKEFNHYAKIVNIPPVQLQDLSKDDWMNFSKKSGKINFNRLSLDEGIRKFKQTPFKERSNEDDKFIKFLSTKIPKLSEKDLDKVFALRKIPPLGGSGMKILFEKMIKRYQVLKSKKIVKILITAFETQYGWAGKNWGIGVDWLILAYKLDKSLTTRLIIESFARLTIEKWGPHDAIERLGLFLFETKQISSLKKIYDITYSFCLGLFRFYSPFTTKYDWLKQFDTKYTNPNEPIVQLFKHRRPYVFAENDVIISKIISHKNILQLKNDSVDAILEKLS